MSNEQRVELRDAIEQAQSDNTGDYCDCGRAYAEFERQECGCGASGCAGCLTYGLCDDCWAEERGG